VTARKAKTAKTRPRAAAHTRRKTSAARAGRKSARPALARTRVQARRPASQTAKKAKPSGARRATRHGGPADRGPRAREIVARLERAYPEAHCALLHGNPLQLLIATILSAQCTDARVNMVTPALFERFPDAEAFSEAHILEVEELIRSTGFYHNKAKNIVGCCQELMMRHGGKVPADLDALVQLPGVGRKTANVVLGNAFGIPGVVVDTHVGRLSQRLDLTSHEDPNKIELDLMETVPREKWTLLAHLLIEHGRRVCKARSPQCGACVLSDLCPSSLA
jgi:endonuclease-3